jgi:hypothetical protein
LILARSLTAVRTDVVNDEAGNVLMVAEERVFFLADLDGASTELILC